MAAPAIHRLEKERVGNHTRTYDPATGETIHVDAPVWSKNDFIHNGTAATSATILPFTPLDTSAVGDTTPVFATSETGGALSCPMDTTNEAQLSGITHGDQLLLSLNKGVNIEARIRLTSASMTGINFAFGLVTAHNAAVASITRYLLARLSGSFALAGEKDSNGDGTDGTAVRTNSALQTLVTATWYILRWDVTDPAVPRLFINGTEITLATALDLSGLSAANAKVQPTIRVGKESAATTECDMLIDYIAFWQGR